MMMEIIKIDPKHLDKMLQDRKILDAFAVGLDEEPDNFEIKPQDANNYYVYSNPDTNAITKKLLPVYSNANKQNIFK